MVDAPVIVVGGGLAGLTAAYQLTRRQCRVTILEARDRVGGRIWMVEHRPGRHHDPDGTFIEGAHAELGAEFIDEDHRRVRELARTLGVELVRVLRGGFTQRFRGDDGAFELARSRAWKDLSDALAPLTAEYARAHGAPDDRRVRELSTYSVREWLRHIEAPARVHAIADTLRGFFLADPEALSALPLAAELSEGESPARVPMYRVAGGNARLLDALVAATRARLLLRHRLVAIRQTPDRVICSVLDDRDVQQELEGAAVIITLPAVVLSGVEVSPALPDAQSRAIRMLRYGCATKVVVQTSDDVFGEGRARAFATDTPLGAFWDASEGQPSGVNMVSFLAGGSASDSLAMRVRDGADPLLSDLCWLRRGTSPRARAWAAWSWEHDPFALGGYAYLDPGFDPAWLPLLRQPHGRLFFAGEHTSEDYQGYMEGAAESGERAADEVLRTDRAGAAFRV